MPGRPQQKVFCESLTRTSNYTIQCKAKGYLMKSGHYRCKNHGGYSDWNAKTKQGKFNALRNLKSLKKYTDEEIKEKYIAY
tara:strand:- start:102 stop:344 length:243 start_codon:yes stop_codon:yes gene_type:complete